MTVLYTGERGVLLHYPRIFCFAERLCLHPHLYPNQWVEMKNIKGHDLRIHLAAIFKNY